MATTFFIDQSTNKCNVTGIIMAGSADFKTGNISTITIMMMMIMLAMMMIMLAMMILKHFAPPDYFYLYLARCSCCLPASSSTAITDYSTFCYSLTATIVTTTSSSDIYNSDLFDPRLHKAVIKLVDVSYGMDPGFNQVLHCSRHTK